MKEPLQKVMLNLVINDVCYVLCSMHVNMATNEFFYHLKYSGDFKEKIWYPGRQEKICRLDHISFHKDGFIHQNFIETRMSKARLPNNTFVPTDQNSCIPLLVHSVYPENGKYPLPQANEVKQDKFSVVTNNFLCPYNKPFSLVLFLTPDGISIEEVLKNYIIQTNKDEKLPLHLLGHLAGRILAWDNWAIDCIVTDLALSLGDYSSLYCHALAYPNMNNILADLLRQRILPF
ncbi:MAG TPA: hypothetical protein VJ201_00770 [Candidatus Babeliales bacterium]|nr:hypothetical protein [Candidatus Babeliales bacterium]